MWQKNDTMTSQCSPVFENQNIYRGFFLTEEVYLQHQQNCVANVAYNMTNRYKNNTKVFSKRKFNIVHDHQQLTQRKTVVSLILTEHIPVLFSITREKKIWDLITLQIILHWVYRSLSHFNDLIRWKSRQIHAWGLRLWW